MTHEEIRAEAIEAAKHARDTHNTPHAGCDADVTFDECDSTECALSRYVLSLHDETPVDRRAAADAVYELIDRRDAIRTAGQLRMIRAASLPHAGETVASE